MLSPTEKSSSLNMANPQFHSINRIKRRSSMILRAPITERRVQVEVIDKLRREPTFSMLTDDQLKTVMKQLCDSDELEKRFFNGADIEEYNRTHGDGLRVSSAAHWKQHHIDLYKQHKQLFSKVTNVTDTTPQSDEQIWKEIETDVKPSFWKLYEVKLILTLGLKGKGRPTPSTLSAPTSPGVSPPTTPKISRTFSTINEKMVKSQLAKLNYSPFQQQSNSHFKFGIPFAALQIGNRVLEWTNNSLCIPQDADYYYSNCHGVTELPFLKVKVVTRDDIKKVFSILVDWNSNKTYDNYICNSQEFVDVILTTLGIEPVFAGTVGDQMRDLQKGSALALKNPELKFSTGDTMGAKTLNFRTHRDVDIACAEFLGAGSATLPIDRVRLLQIYDRMFWLWWSALSEAKEKGELSQDEQELKARATSCKDCHFGWPWTEGSVKEKPEPFLFHTLGTSSKIPTNNNNNVANKAVKQ